MDGGNRDKKAQRLAIKEGLFFWKVPFRNMKPEPRERPRTRMGTSGTKACVTADLSFSVDAGKEIQMDQVVLGPSSEEHAMAELRPVRHQSGLTYSAA